MSFSFLIYLSKHHYTRISCIIAKFDEADTRKEELVTARHYYYYKIIHITYLLDINFLLLQIVHDVHDSSDVDLPINTFRKSFEIFSELQKQNVIQYDTSKA